MPLAKKCDSGESTLFSFPEPTAFKSAAKSWWWWGGGLFPRPCLLPNIPTSTGCCQIHNAMFSLRPVFLELGRCTAWSRCLVRRRRHEVKLSEFTDVSLPRVQWYNFKWYLMYCQPCNAEKLRVEHNQRMFRQRWEMYECQ